MALLALHRGFNGALSAVAATRLGSIVITEVSKLS
jgi:hypothetical protein